MHAEERNAEILRLAKLLVEAIGAEEKAPAAIKLVGSYALPELETRRRTVGRIRLYLESAADHLDRASEHADILGDQFGL